MGVKKLKLNENMGEIVKSRKAQKKQKEKELLENYDKIQISN